MRGTVFQIIWSMQRVVYHLFAGDWPRISLTNIALKFVMVVFLIFSFTCNLRGGMCDNHVVTSA